MCVCVYVCQIKILVRIYTSSPKSNFSLIQQPNLGRGFAVTYHRYVNIKCVKRPESSSCISSTIYLWDSLNCDEFSGKLFYLTYSHSCVCFQLFDTTFCNFHKFRDIHLVLGLKFATLCPDYFFVPLPVWWIFYWMLRMDTREILCICYAYYTTSLLLLCRCIWRYWTSKMLVRYIVSSCV